MASRRLLSLIQVSAARVQVRYLKIAG